MEKDYKNDEPILVFKTNLTFKEDVKRISKWLDTEQRITCWNVDLTDIDNILRIESTHLAPHNIIQMITAAGYSCEELKD